MVLFNGSVQMFYTRPSDQKIYCFTPVPLMGESQEFLKTGAGETLSLVKTLTFTGTLLATIPELSGVPDESTCISLLSRKRTQLQEALSEDYGDLLIVDISGYPIISCKPRVTELSFDEGILVQQSPYSITFEYDEVLDSGVKVKSYSNTWSFSQNENDTIGVSHNVSAQGIRDTTLGIEPHIVAKDFVLSKIGFSPSHSSAMKPPYTSSLVNIDNFTAYNRVLSEDIDITEGSYSVSETWVASSGNYLDDRSISNTFARDEEGNFFETLEINGNIQGYGEDTFERLQNAEDAFTNYVSAEIGFDETVGVESKQKSSNRINGSVSYSISKVPTSGGQPDLINKSINRSFERGDDGSVIQTVTTSAAVRISSASGIELAIDYCYANNEPIDSTNPIFDASLSGNILSISTQRSELDKSFSLTRSFKDQATLNYYEEYSINVQKSLDTPQVSISIEGTVYGIGLESTTKGSDRFTYASGAYFGIIEPLIPSRIAEATPAGFCISDYATTETFGYGVYGGTISYSKTFETRLKTSNPNILKEEIDVSFDFPARIVQSISIPGKADGPILQDQETVTGKTKNLSIQYSMKKEDDSCGNSIIPSNLAIDEAITESNILIENTALSNPRGEKPVSSKVFKTADTMSFNRQTYQFTRNVTWLYL